MSRVLRKREFLDPRFCSVYLSARFKTALLCKSNVDDKVWNPKHIRNPSRVSPSGLLQRADHSVNLAATQVCSWLWL